MALIPNELKTIWQDITDDFNADLGYRCALVFAAGHRETTQVSTIQDGRMPRTILPYGGRAHGFLHAGHGIMSETTEDPDAHIQKDESKKIIVARIYNITRDVDRLGIRVTEGKSVFELITNKRYMPDLVRASKIELFIDLEEAHLEAKNIREPIAYGLGVLHQCRSFWEEI